MSKAQFFKVLFKQQFEGSKYKLQTVFCVFTLSMILIEEIIIFQIQTSNSNKILKSAFFPIIPLSGTLFSLIYFILMGSGFILQKTQEKQKNEKFWKNSTYRISLIIRHLIKIIYLPSIMTTFNLIKNQINSQSKAKITSAAIFTFIILSSQLIITWLQNIHLFSIKAQTFGKNGLRNPSLIVSIHNILFPFVCQEKWSLIVIDVLAFVIIGWEILKNPRLSQQYDRWYRMCISGFVAVQFFIIVQYFQQNQKQNGIIIFFSFILAIAIYLLIQKLYESSIRESEKLKKPFYLLREIYYNLTNKNHQNVALMLLSHQRTCTDIQNCYCRKVLFNQELLSQSTQRQLVPKNRDIHQNALKMVIEFYENLFDEKAPLEISKIQLEFEEKSAELLFFVCILVRNHKKYSKAFLLLKSYQKRWKDCSFMFQIETEILIQEITELKGIHQAIINQNNNLYNDYWIFYEKYETFLKYYEQVTILAQQIWLEMINQQPDEEKVFSAMKRFNVLDKKISFTYQSLLVTSPEHSNQINSLMKKYETVILNIFNEKLSVVKNANVFLEKKSSQLKGDDQILDKEGRIFSKSLNNIVFLVNVEKVTQESESENIQHKNKVFKEKFERNAQINSLNQLILPEMRQSHNKLLLQFLMAQNPSLNHSNSILLIQINGEVREIEACQIWCQTVIMNDEILISVILNNDQISKRHGLFVQNEKEEIIYHSRNLNNFVQTKNNFSIFRSPEDENFIPHKQTQSSYYRGISLCTEQIMQFKHVNMKLYRVELQGFEEVDMIQQEEKVVEDSKNSETLNSYSDQKASMIDEIIQKIQNSQKNEKVIKLEKFYQDIHRSKHQHTTLKLTIFFILTTFLFIGLLTVCYLSNIQKSSTISLFSTKIDAFSKLINSICETDTAAKLLIIKSYFEEGFTDYQKGIDIIDHYKKQILDNIAQIANENSIFSIYHLKEDSSSFFSNQTEIQALMNGLLKQVTFLTDQPFQSFGFSPILSQNILPLSRIVSNFFEANFNVVNQIFIKIFFSRGNFFQNNIVQRLYDFSQNLILIFGGAGVSFMILLCGLVIFYRKKDQLVVNQGLEIFEKISLQHKSLRLKKVRESKESQFSYQMPKISSKSPTSFINTLRSMKSNRDSQNIDSNSFNFFEGILTQQKTLSTQKVPEKVGQETQVPFFSRIAEIGRKKIFKGEKYQISCLIKILYFLPFFIYFTYQMIQNVMFNSEMEKALNFQNILAWQGQFIAGSRQYSIELGMFELPFDLGASNVRTIEEIYQVMHEIKKQEEMMDTDTEFSRMRYLLDSTNVCQNINILSQSQTLGVEITKQKCMDKRLGLSLGKGKGFHQALVYYLETIRDFSRLNSDPFNFTLERRHKILQSETLRTIVHLAEYLHQLNEVEYNAYKQDLNNKLNRFKKINDIVVGLIIALWVILTFFAWKFITKKKKEQANLIKAVFKLISFKVLAKSNDLVEKVIKNKIHSYIK